MVLGIRDRLKRWEGLYRFLRVLQMCGTRQVRNVPVSICTNPMGFSYGTSGWNYLVEQVRQLHADDHLAIEDTVLYKYHQRYQPTDMSDLPMSAGARVSFRPSLSIYPWGSFKVDSARIGGIAKDPLNSRFYGPSSLALVKQDISNLAALYESLSTEGYTPWHQGHSLVGGVFLERSDGQRRFVVLQGNHRTAVLSYLGHTNIKVRFLRGHFHTIRERQITNWYYVRLGSCSLEDARAYFHAFFRLTGLERAISLGLLAGTRDCKEETQTRIGLIGRSS